MLLLIKLHFYAGNRGAVALIDDQNVEIAVGVLVAGTEKRYG